MIVMVRALVGSTLQENVENVSNLIVQNRNQSSKANIVASRIRKKNCTTFTYGNLISALGKKKKTFYIAHKESLS